MGFFYPLEVTGCSVRWLVLQRFAKQLGTVRSRLSSIDYKKKKKLLFNSVVKKSYFPRLNCNCVLQHFMLSRWLPQN